MTDLIELENIHLKTDPKNSYIGVTGKYQYYHYKCDGFDDVGWGCGYRTTQTICSWIREQIISENCPSASQVAKIPSIIEIQKILSDCGDKPGSFVGSKEWIGSYETMIVIDTLFNVPCRIVHCQEVIKFDKIGGSIKEHFEKFGSPIMMGGDVDAASKGVIGYAGDNSNEYLLIADPHVKKDNFLIDDEYLLKNKWISWRDLDSFERNSFYNFCLPLKKASNKMFAFCGE